MLAGKCLFLISPDYCICTHPIQELGRKRLFFLVFPETEGPLGHFPRVASHCPRLSLSNLPLVELVEI